MIDLFYQGGVLFMGILTLIFLVMLVLAFLYGSAVFRGSLTHANGGKDKIDLIRKVGVFALMVGILGQLIGLFEAFQQLQEIKEVSPALVAGGLRVSMITTLYGLVISVVAYLIYFLLRANIK